MIMVVEPESLCWVAGTKVSARDGPTGAEQFAPLPNLRAVVRDDGSGLGHGFKLDNARRRAAGEAEVEQTLDVFHTLREGGRAVRQTWGGAKSAFEFFTPCGRLNDRARAEAVVAAVLPDLCGVARVKPWRLLVRRESFAFQDQVGDRLAELGLAPEVLSALLDQEGCIASRGATRRRHEPGRWPERCS